MCIQQIQQIQQNSRKNTRPQGNKKKAVVSGNDERLWACLVLFCLFVSFFLSVFVSLVSVFVVCLVFVACCVLFFSCCWLEVVVSFLELVFVVCLVVVFCC